MRIRWGLAFAAALATVDATAVQTEFLPIADPSLMTNQLGVDGLWNTPDDKSRPEANPNGAASYYNFDGIALEGFTIANAIGNGAFADPGDAPANFGSYDINFVSGSGAGVQHCLPSVCGTWLNGTFDTELNVGASSNVMTIFDNHTFHVDYAWEITSSAGDAPPPVGFINVLSTTGTGFGHGFWISNGDDPAVLFASNPRVVAHFNTLLGIIPEDFTTLYWAPLRFDGGRFSISAYSVAAIPLPTSLVMLVPPLLMLFRVRR